MKIHILTFSSRNFITPVTKKNLELLKEAAENLGHEAEIIYEKECFMKFFNKPQLLIRNKRPKDIKILLVRANFLSSYMEYRSGLIKQFELIKTPIINKYLPVLKAKNKLRTLQTLNKHKVPIPKTYILRSTDYLDEMAEKIGSFPVILKTVFGSHGSGVSIVESRRGLNSIVGMLTDQSSSLPIMIQEYVKESKGKDIRVFIVGKRIIGAMERIATKRGEFRSNFHLGGRVRVAEMTRKEKDVAFAAVSALGLDIAGVDILRTKTGPKVLEVNANPGLEGITKATGRDVAGEIIKYCVKKAKRLNNKKSKSKKK
ncbi:MAG: RimK family alpha-L-glutamate ligase [Candidatus Magasanikbacteria bacterium]|nr:RimK family alpha-L-glutamate ligase [Candidatus Magasanikbacteria bacterium]